METKTQIKRIRTQKEFVGESLTEQNHKKNVNINTLVRNANRTGNWVGTRKAPQYGDFTQVNDLASAIEQVNLAEGGFMALDAKVRDFFDNSPIKMLHFLENAENKEKAIELGLIDRPEPESPAEEPSEAKITPETE